MAVTRQPERGWRLLGWKSLIVVVVLGGCGVLETVFFQSFAGSVIIAVLVGLAMWQSGRRREPAGQLSH